LLCFTKHLAHLSQEAIAAWREALQHSDERTDVQLVLELQAALRDPSTVKARVKTAYILPSSVWTMLSPRQRGNMPCRRMGLGGGILADGAVTRLLHPGRGG
jgi:hypothetical protein